MRAICGITEKRGKFYRVEFTRLTQPVPVATFELKAPTGDEIVTWSSPRPATLPNKEIWLLDTSAHDPAWMDDYSTDPLPGGRRRLITQPLYERECDCGLVPGQACNCMA